MFFLCYLLPSSFKIFINVFAFLYIKPNSKEICEEISFPSFFRKILMSAFWLRSKANYLEKMHGYSHLFFVESNSLCKGLLFLHSPLAQEHLYLVGTILKMPKIDKKKCAKCTLSDFFHIWET